MGQNNSTQADPMGGSISFSSSMPNDYIKMSNDGPDDYDSFAMIEKPLNLYDFGYAGIWSIQVSSFPSPQPRVGHFTCFSEEQQIAYIGYGNGKNSEEYDDLWALDLKTFKWRNIPLQGKLLHRTGSRAVLKDNLIFVFGGYYRKERQYFGELHTINVDTGVISIVQATGDPPTPRSTPILGIYNNKLFIWGGYSGSYPDNLSVLDLNTCAWTHYKTDTTGRTGIPFTQINDIIYTYGGSKSDGILKINLSNNTVREFPSFGTPPHSYVIGAEILAIDHYLFYFGGKTDETKTFLYAFDLNKNSWFIFHVKPDNKTVTLSDGEIKKGDFKLPNIHSFSLTYTKNLRSLIGFLGAPMSFSTELFIISIGEPLSVLHLSDDMSAMLKLH